VRLWTPVVLLAALAWSSAAMGQTGTRGGLAAVTPITGTKPAWSPDGKLIAFADQTGPTTGASWRLFVVGVDGRGRRQVIDVGRDAPHAVSWAPNGNSLAYDAFDTEDGVTSVFTVAVAGGRPAKITSGWAPSWGPDNKLLFVDQSTDLRDDRVFVVNADGTARQQLEPCFEVDIGGCFDGNPDWSSDGKRILLDSVRGSASAVWTMDPDGSNRRIITPFVPAAAYPRWSPDGSKIAYHHFDVAASTPGDVSVMNADGTASQVVAKNGGFPDWSADGKTIVFTRAGVLGESLYLVDAGGSNERQLTAPAPPVAARCVVPKLAGKTLAAATALLKKANCKTGKVTRVKSKKVKRGAVVSSKPKAGTSAPAGTSVALIVSRGK
jgi:Tol biopolymer transport system component